MSGEGGAASGAGLRSTLARVADAALALARTRAELASVELAEERLRWTRSAMFIAGAVLMFAFAVLGIGAFVVVYFWDSHRLAAVAGVTVAFAAIGAILLWQNNAMWRNAPKPFAQTLAEFEKDRELFQRVSEREPEQ